MHRWRPGLTGALAMGAEHGAWCIGCCWALMVVLFALGAMSIAWMALVAALVLVEKVLPRGERLAAAVAAVLLALGVWTAVGPSSVPWLTSPGLRRHAGDDGRARAGDDGRARRIDGALTGAPSGRPVTMGTVPRRPSDVRRAARSGGAAARLPRDDG